MTGVDPMLPYEIQNALRAHTVEQLRDIHRRLRYFSFVVPRPKESEGDSLQARLRVDPADAAPLTQALGGAGVLDSELYARREGHVDVRLWNERDPYEVDESMVRRAEGIEVAIDLACLAALTTTDGPSFLSPHRHPQFFDAV